VKSHAALSASIVHFSTFAAGVGLMLGVKLFLEP